MRASGKTTRTVDEAIQKLFKYGVIIIPFNIGNKQFVNERNKDILVIDSDAKVGNQAQREMCARLRKRLHSEHNGQFTFNIKEQSITLKKKDNEA